MAQDRANKALAFQLLQTTYYDSIDRGDMQTAVTALHADIEWSHEQVWEHHDFRRTGSPTVLIGRSAVEKLLSARVDEMREARIEHKIRDMVFEDGKGAFLVAVVGGEREVPFMVWFEIKDDLISRYVLRPL